MIYDKTIYEFLADACVWLHVAVIIFWGGGFILYVPWRLSSNRKFSRFVNFHLVFSVINFTSQFIFSWNCPLTLLENYFRGIYNPSLITEEPFTLRFIREIFGISIPGTVLTLIIIIGTAQCLVVLISNKTYSLEQAPD